MASSPPLIPSRRHREYVLSSHATCMVRGPALKEQDRLREEAARKAIRDVGKALDDSPPTSPNADIHPHIEAQKQLERDLQQAMQDPLPEARESRPKPRSQNPQPSSQKTKATPSIGDRIKAHIKRNPNFYNALAAIMVFIIGIPSVFFGFCLVGACPLIAALMIFGGATLLLGGQILFNIASEDLLKSQPQVIYHPGRTESSPPPPRPEPVMRRYVPVVDGYKMLMEHFI